MSDQEKPKQNEEQAGTEEVLSEKDLNQAAGGATLGWDVKVNKKL